MLHITEDLTRNKKNPVYRGLADKRPVTCIMLPPNIAAYIEQMARKTHSPPLLMSGHTPGGKYACLVYNIALSPVNWTLNTRAIHGHLSTVMHAMHSAGIVLYSGKTTGSSADIMAENQAVFSTYYFVNFNHSKATSDKLEFAADHIKLIDILCNSPVTYASQYAFYKYLVKSSVYPKVAAAIKEKQNTQVYFIKLRLLFMLKYYDLYLKACGVPDHVYNKFQYWKHPDATYYISQLGTQTAKK